MSYYYDILLNFQEEYYMFYEWEENDPIEFIKKIPIYNVSNKVYIDLLTSKIKVNNDFLNNILDKTKLKQNKTLTYTCIFGDGKNALAVEFNNDGTLINKSSILLDDEININEFMYGIDEYDLKYEIISKDRVRIDTRQDENIKNILNIEIKNIYKNKEYSKLKYIYLEWFNKLSDDYNTMYNNMLDRLKNKLTKKEYDIYNLLKITFNV